jgi:hypothetical protein
MSIENSPSAVGRLWRPAILLTGIGVTNQAVGFVIPPGLTAVITAGDFFYYGNTSTPQLDIINPVQADLRLWSWRPQTSSDQSFHWETWQVIGQQNYIQAAVTDGTFDVSVCGWMVPGDVTIPQ